MAAEGKTKKSAKTHLETQGFKQYDRLRKYLGLIYLYGCFRAEDLAKVNNRSVQHYNATIKLLWELFWQDQGDTATMKRKNNKTCPYIPRSYTASAQNRMADSYMMFSVDRKAQVLLCLRTLQRLRSGDARASDLEKSMIDQMLLDKVILDEEVYQNARNLAVQLTQFGYYTQTPRGKYARHIDGVEALELEELLRLYTYVCFAANVTYPRVPGSFLRRTLERELLRRGEIPPEVSPFVLRHNSSHNVFDEEVVFRLLHLMDKKQAISIDGVKHLPVQLRVDCRMGRWYALMAREEEGRLVPCIRAVSRMELPTACQGGNDPAWAEAKALVEKTYSHSLFSGITEDAPVTVEARLLFGAEQGRRDQFVRELRMGEVVQTPDGEVYRAEVSDPLELIPLLRSYAPWLRVLPGNHDLDTRLRQSLEQMRADLQDAPWEVPVENTRTFEKRKSAALPGGARDEAQECLERILLSPFQGRMIQFCLELLASLEGGFTPDAERMGKKYGITNPDDALRLLRHGGILQPQGLSLCKKHGLPPMLPLSQVEREYLQFILDPQNVPEVVLFLPEKTRQKLRGEAPAWAAHIRWHKPRGADLPQDPGPADFRGLLDAIRQRRMIRYSYRTRASDEEKTARCLPWKLEYSAYDRRWWIILYDIGSQSTVKARLDNLRHIQVEEETAVTEEQILQALEKLRSHEEVVLRVRDEHNALQRCYTAFENQPISDSRFSSEEGYILKFRPYRFDEQEVLRQLMYLGPKVRLEGPESMRQTLKERLIDAL